MMQNTFLTTLATALTGTQHRLNISIESAHSNGLKVVVTADLGPTPEKATEAEAQLRAAMCRPLIVTGPAEGVETDLQNRLTQHVRALDHGQSLLDEILQIGSEVRATVKAAPAAAAPSAADLEDEEDDTLPRDLEAAREEAIEDGNGAEINPDDPYRFF